MNPPDPRRATDPLREALPEPIPPNPSPTARVLRWLYDWLRRR